MVADQDGRLFRQLTNGWVPCNILVAPEGTVLFAENEFDETGSVAAIAALYERASPSPLDRQADQPAVERRVPSSTAARIVVVGGGVGGLVTARELRRRLGREHQVLLIDRSPVHLFAPSLLWLMVGRREPQQIQRPLIRLTGHGIDFYQGDVRGIDLDRRVVRTPSTAFEFDYLPVPGRGHDDERDARRFRTGARRPCGSNGMRRFSASFA